MEAPGRYRSRRRVPSPHRPSVDDGGLPGASWAFPRDVPRPADPPISCGAPAISRRSGARTISGAVRVPEPRRTPLGFPVSRLALSTLPWIVPLRMHCARVADPWRRFCGTVANRFFLVPRGSTEPSPVHEDRQWNTPVSHGSKKTANNRFQPAVAGNGLEGLTRSHGQQNAATGSLKNTIDGCSAEISNKPSIGVRDRVERASGARHCLCFVIWNTDQVRWWGGSRTASPCRADDPGRFKRFPGLRVGSSSST